jgi:hypothetical protein
MLDEIYYLVKFANFSHRDVLSMPIFERRYYIGKLTEEFKTKQEEFDKRKNSK